MTYTEVVKSEGIQVPENKGEVEKTYAVFYPYDGFLAGPYPTVRDAEFYGIEDILGVSEAKGARVVKITIEVM